MCQTFDLPDVPRLIEYRHVDSTLRAMMKGVQASGEVPEENLDDVVGELLLGVAPKLS